jgi:hypothetical protein
MDDAQKHFAEAFWHKTDTTPVPLWAKIDDLKKKLYKSEDPTAIDVINREIAKLKVEQHKEELAYLVVKSPTYEKTAAYHKGEIEKLTVLWNLSDSEAESSVIVPIANDTDAHSEQRLEALKMAAENKKKEAQEDEQREFTRSKTETIDMAKKLKGEGKKKWQAAKRLFPSKIKEYNEITGEGSVVKELRRKRKQAIEKRVQKLWN